MPRINLIGASNRQTNSTCVFGSMAGLAPTATKRPHITGLHGYKYTRSAANGTIWDTGAILPRDVKGLSEGCGLNRDKLGKCDNGRKCVKFIGDTTTGVAYRTGSVLLG
jgi:hypothetical protein|tara:strand:+ start:1246 stop:1572 length:327 start_codon:yes stop_codon:yes gene_type:complete